MTPFDVFLYSKKNKSKHLFGLTLGNIDKSIHQDFRWKSFHISQYSHTSDRNRLPEKRTQQDRHTSRHTDGHTDRQIDIQSNRDRYTDGPRRKLTLCTSCNQIVSSCVVRSVGPSQNQDRWNDNRQQTRIQLAEDFKRISPNDGKLFARYGHIMLSLNILILSPLPTITKGAPSNIDSTNVHVYRLHIFLIAWSVWSSAYNIRYQHQLNILPK